MISAHDGGVWDVASSQGAKGAGVHALVLSAGCDGICSIVSVTNRVFWGSKVFISQYSQLTVSEIVQESIVPDTERRGRFQNVRGVCCRGYTRFLGDKL
jgi:hypothetical protein